MYFPALCQSLVLFHYFAAVHSHSAPSLPSVFGLDSTLNTYLRLPPRYATPPTIEHEFSSGQACGIQNGNSSCSAGQCCNSQGQCGTGRSFCDAPYCQFLFGPACDANISPRGVNTSTVPRPVLGSIKNGDKGIITNCTKPGYVALTFDDGPYQYTSELLDILKKNDVPVTFFVTANNMGKNPIDWADTGYPAIIQRMIVDGHQIGSHTWSHQDLNVLNTQERRDQMIKNEMALNNILGFFPTYMRPPYNSCQRVTGCLTDIGALGYHIIEYNLDTNDFVNLTPESYTLTQNNVTVGLQNGNPETSDYMIFSHDILPMTVHNLTQWMIDTIKGQGYNFATVGDCLGDPISNWYRDPTTGQGLTEVVIKPANTSLSLSNGVSSAASSATSSGATAATSQTSTATGSTVSGTTTHSSAAGFLSLGMADVSSMLLLVAIAILF